MIKALKTYTLPDHENHYGMIDYELGYDLKDERFIPEMKTYLREENGKAVPGHLMKNIYDLDNICQQYVVMEPTVTYPVQDGFICHPGVEFVGVILEGYGKVSFPDGESHDFRPGDCWYFKAGQPYRIENNERSLLKFFTAHTSPIAEIPYEYLPADCGVVIENGHGIRNIDTCEGTLAPGFTGHKADAGHWTTLMFEGDNICVLHPVQGPGCSSPMFDYVSHPNVHELEFALEGNAMVIMPDKAYKLSPRIARYNPELQPSKTFNYTDENLKLLVWYSTGRLANVGRIQNHAVTFECRNL